MSKQKTPSQTELRTFFNSNGINQSQAVAIAKGDNARGINPNQAREIKRSMASRKILNYIRTL